MIKYNYYGIEKEIVYEENEHILYIKTEAEYNRFLEDILLNDYIVLKEEKEILLFYMLLSKNAKKEFEIEKYFDCINIAYNYYNLISKIYDNNIEYNDFHLEKWKMNKLKYVYEIHNKMIDYAKNKKIVPRYLKYFEYTINYDYLSKYEKIVLINKFSINKKEKEILDKLDILVEFDLYIDSQDYDEKENILKNISNVKTNSDIKAISFKNNKQLNMYLTQYLSNLENQDISIFDLKQDKSIYNNINQKLFNCGINISFNTTKSYKILKYLYNILKDDKLIYHIYYSFLDKDFAKFFEIDKTQIEKVKKDMAYNKKYVNVFENKYSLYEIVNKLADKYKDEASILLEAYAEILAIDDFEFKDIVNTYEEKLLLFLKYLDHKFLNNYVKDSKYKIETVNSFDKKDYIILLNIQEDILPKSKNFILTNSDMKEYGLKINLDYKFEKYYEYLRSLINSKKATLLFVENLDENISVYSLFKDFLYRNNIKSTELTYSSKDIINFHNYIYDVKNFEYDKDFLTENDKIKVQKDEIDYIHITGSNFTYFLNSFMDLCLDSIMKKNNFTNINTDIESISSSTIGNIVHRIFELAIANKQYKVDELLKIKEIAIEEFKDYIITDYISMYKRILFSDDLIIKISKFLNSIKDFEILAEVPINKDYRGMRVSLRQDIVYKDDKDNINIIDVKAGKSNDKYSDQLVAYKLFNEEFGQKVDKIALYYPYEKEYLDFVDYKEDIRETIINKIDSIKQNDSDIEIDLDEKTNLYGFDNILRIKDYEK